MHRDTGVLPHAVNDVADICFDNGLEIVSIIGYCKQWSPMCTIFQHGLTIIKDHGFTNGHSLPAMFEK